MTVECSALSRTFILSPLRSGIITGEGIERPGRYGEDSKVQSYVNDTVIAIKSSEQLRLPPLGLNKTEPDNRQ